MYTYTVGLWFPKLDARWRDDMEGFAGTGGYYILSLTLLCVFWDVHGCLAFIVLLPLYLPTPPTIPPIFFLPPFSYLSLSMPALSPPNSLVPAPSCFLFLPHPWCGVYSPSAFLCSPSHLFHFLFVPYAACLPYSLPISRFFGSWCCGLAVRFCTFGRTGQEDRQTVEQHIPILCSHTLTAFWLGPSASVPAWREQRFLLPRHGSF